MTNGKIVNKQTGLEIPCVLKEEFIDCLGVRVTGTSVNNTFYKSEWDFVADRPALPTEPGLYKATPEDTFPEHQRILLLSTSGKWSWLDASYDGTLTPLKAEYLEVYSETITRVEV